MANKDLTTRKNRFSNFDWMDDEMKELAGELSKCIVPRSQRKAAVRTNYHVPYYSHGRYSYL